MGDMDGSSSLQENQSHTCDLAASETGDSQLVLPTNP